MKRNTIITSIALMALAVLALTAVACSDETTAQQPVDERPARGITVSGEGKATAPPDLAQLSLGVSTLRPTVAEAREQGAAALDAMIASLRANGVAEKDIQTEHLSIQPEYDYRDNEQILRGFRVSNVVSVKVRDIDSTSKVVDDAVSAGGDSTQIQGIFFTIDDPKELQKQAREAAVADAKAKAETLAKAGGVSLGDPIVISEGGGVTPIPLEAAAFDEARQAGASTPIQPGELDITINVGVTYGIS